MTDLVERVARAICEERCWRGAWEKANDVERASWERDAIAAIRVVVEECARVVKARDMGDGTREDQEAHRCSKAIRALAKGDGK